MTDHLLTKSTCAFHVEDDSLVRVDVYDFKRIESDHIMFILQVVLSLVVSLKRCRLLRIGIA
jgi:hypothetical protein